MKHQRRHIYEAKDHGYTMDQNDRTSDSAIAYDTVMEDLDDIGVTEEGYKALHQFASIHEYDWRFVELVIKDKIMFSCVVGTPEQKIKKMEDMLAKKGLEPECVVRQRERFEKWRREKDVPFEDREMSGEAARRMMDMLMGLADTAGGSLRDEMNRLGFGDFGKGASGLEDAVDMGMPIYLGELTKVMKKVFGSKTEGMKAVYVVDDELYKSLVDDNDVHNYYTPTFIRTVMKDRRMICRIGTTRVTEDNVMDLYDINAIKDSTTLYRKLTALDQKMPFMIEVNGKPKMVESAEFMKFNEFGDEWHLLVLRV